MAFPSRRFKVLTVGQDELLGVLRRLVERDKAKVPAYFSPFDYWPAMPADVTVDAVYYDYSRRGWGVILWSSEFPEVPGGQEIPIFNDAAYERRAIAASMGLPVSLPPVVKTWEGKNAADAPQAKPESPKEAAARRLQELTRKIERQEPAPRSEWLQARLDLGHWVEMNVEETTGRINSYRIDIGRFTAPPINAEAVRHILLFPGHRVMPTAGTIGILDGPGDFFAPEPERPNAEIARQLVEDHRDEILGVVRPMVEAPPVTGKTLTAADVNATGFGFAIPAEAVTAGERIEIGEPVYGPGYPFSESRKAEARRNIEAYCDRYAPACIGSFDCNAGDHSDACPAKSEARLALEYDLRQALAPMEGPAIEDAISAGPDLLLTDALRRARAGDKNDAARYLLRKE